MLFFGLIIKIIESMAKTIVSIFNFFERKLNKKNTSNNEKNNISNNNLLKEINVRNTPYDNHFSKVIISRGKEYYEENKVTNYSFENNICEGTVTGTTDYKVKISF